MTEPKTTELFTGTYRHTVDAGRRVVVPVQWRGPSFPEALVGLTWPVTERRYLLFLLPHQCQRMLEQISFGTIDERHLTALQRTLAAQAFPAPLDPRGRLRLPEEAAQQAGIDHEAVLVGLLDKFEIWSPERYRDCRKEDQAQASKLVTELEL